MKLSLSVLILCVTTVVCVRYEPTWDSLDSRPLPAWYDESKIGIFLHWGVFSVPSFGRFSSEWLWWRWVGEKVDVYVKYMQDNYRPDFTYADFAPMFHAEFFDPDKWAEMFQAAGARYVVLTSKHHEGFTNWPSGYSFNWNSRDVGPKRDLVGDLANAIRNKTDIRFGLYYSMFEWFHPLYLYDKANNYQTQEFIKAKMMPEMRELVNMYKPDVFWSDGEWMAPDTYWNSTQFVAWLYNDSPVRDSVAINDRWGNNTNCKHGGFWDCTDRYTPSKPLQHKWENCLTIDTKSWGFRRNAEISDIISIDDLIGKLASTVSLGGNFLVNVGPTAYGEIPPVYEERLRQMGAWLEVNGEAIYKSQMWTYQNDSLAKNVWYTAQTNASSTTISVYAILLDWPEENQLILGRPVASGNISATMLGYTSGHLPVSPMPGGGIRISFPDTLRNELPCKWAWVLKLTGLTNAKIRLQHRTESAIRIPMEKTQETVQNTKKYDSIC